MTLSGLAHALSQWTPQHWNALGNVMLGIGALVGGIFGLHTWRKAVRTREAEWLDRLFERFYLDGTFSPVLLSFEYDFASGTDRLVDRVLTMETPVLGPDEIARIRNVDVVLNFLEHLLYLTSDRHLLARDRDAMFGYWLGLLSQPRYASLRQYAVQFGYEHVARHSNASRVRHVFLYGSLTRGNAAHAEFGLDRALRRRRDGLGVRRASRGREQQHEPRDPSIERRRLGDGRDRRHRHVRGPRHDGSGRRRRHLRRQAAVPGSGAARDRARLDPVSGTSERESGEPIRFASRRVA